MTKVQKSYAFETTMAVRDYEVDIEGIVNNAIYLHYLEHTRHLFCRQAGLSFGEMHSRGIDPVLRRAEVDYMTPLRPDDSFRSCLNLYRRGPRFVFEQDLYRESDGAQVIHALITIACLENGRLSRGDVLAEAFGQYISTDE